MSNCFFANKNLSKELSAEARLIQSAEVESALGENQFRGLAKLAIDAGVKSSKEWDKYLRPFEVEILKIREANGVKVRTSTGKWLISKAVLDADGKKPNSSYRVRKSVIGKTLDAGMPLLDANGNVLSKDVMEKSYRSKDEKFLSDYHKAMNAARTIKKAWANLDGVEQACVREELGLSS